MKLELKSPADLLNKGYALQSPGMEYLARFRTDVAPLLDQLHGDESEEYQKNHIRDFLKDMLPGITITIASTHPTG